MSQRLPPSVQDSGEADLGAEMLGGAGNGLERLGCGCERLPGFQLFQPTHIRMAISSRDCGRAGIPPLILHDNGVPFSLNCTTHELSLINCAAHKLAPHAARKARSSPRPSRKMKVYQRHKVGTRLATVSARIHLRRKERADEQAESDLDLGLEPGG